MQFPIYFSIYSSRYWKIHIDVKGGHIFTSYKLQKYVIVNACNMDETFEFSVVNNEACKLVPVKLFFFFLETSSTYPFVFYFFYFFFETSSTYPFVF